MSDTKTDLELIEEFVDWAGRAGLSVTGIAEITGLSLGWASRLVRGRYKSLRFQTRIKIREILEKKNP